MCDGFGGRWSCGIRRGGCMLTFVHCRWFGLTRLNWYWSSSCASHICSQLCDECVLLFRFLFLLCKFFSTSFGFLSVASTFDVVMLCWLDGDFGVPRMIEFSIVLTTLSVVAQSRFRVVQTQETMLLPMTPCRGPCIRKVGVVLRRVRQHTWCTSSSNSRGRRS